MPFIKKPLKAAIQLVSTTDFREDDLKIAQERFQRISKAFQEYGLSIPHPSSVRWQPDALCAAGDDA